MIYFIGVLMLLTVYMSDDFCVPFYSIVPFLLQLKLCYAHPQTGMIVEDRLEVHKDDTLAEATVQAHKVNGCGDTCCACVEWGGHF